MIGEQSIASRSPGSPTSTGHAPSLRHAAAAGESRQGGNETVTFCIRPEAIRVIAPGETVPAGWASVEVRVSRVEFLGALTRMETQLSDGMMLRVALLDQPLATLAAGQPLTLAYDPRRVTGFKSS